MRCKRRVSSGPTGTECAAVDQNEFAGSQIRSVGPLNCPGELLKEEQRRSFATKLVSHREFLEVSRRARESKFLYVALLCCMS